jgi:hypothetical protein
VRRLRQVLERFPHITFGRYTGDTPERAGDGASLFAQLIPGQARLPGELLSREEMRDGPPHLLLTNYAMLEYLLLRPADIDLFEGKHSGHWRFIVLDEAHVYDGAKAEEVGMLLRRLRERVGHFRGNYPERTGLSLQAIATSATVGDRPQAVMDFAAKLFDAPFEWSDGDPGRQDLVRSAASYIQRAGREWKTAGDFFLPGASATAPCQRVRAFLTPVPAEVHGALRAILPLAAGQRLGVEDGTRVDELAALLEQVRAELTYDVATFEFDADLTSVRGHRQVTDAYLASLAAHYHGYVATFDKGFAATHPDLAVLIG